MQTQSGRPASQRADELRDFIALLLDRGVRSYLEIGARHGDTFFEVMRALPSGSRGVAIDLPGGLWGTVRSVPFLEGAAQDLRALGYDVHVILGDSRTDEIRERIAELGHFDAIFIDGDHSLSSVTADWENYRDLASIMAFHDIAGEGIVQRTTGQPVEVPMLWNSIKAEHNTIEIIGHERGMGIGVVFL